MFHQVTKFRLRNIRLRMPRNFLEFIAGRACKSAIKLGTSTRASPHDDRGKAFWPVVKAYRDCRASGPDYRLGAGLERAQHRARPRCGRAILWRSPICGAKSAARRQGQRQHRSRRPTSTTRPRHKFQASCAIAPGALRCAKLFRLPQERFPRLGQTSGAPHAPQRRPFLHKMDRDAISQQSPALCGLLTSPGERRRENGTKPGFALHALAAGRALPHKNPTLCPIIVDTKIKAAAVRVASGFRQGGNSPRR